LAGSGGAGRNELALCDVPSDTVLRKFPRVDRWRGPIAVAPDGKALIVSRSDKSKPGSRLLDQDLFVVWDVAGNKSLRSLPGQKAYHVTLTPDGKRLLCFSGMRHRLELRDAVTG